jgi:hypothetical protein
LAIFPNGAKSQPQLRHIRHRQEHLSAAGQRDKSEFFVKGKPVAAVPAIAMPTINIPENLYIYFYKQGVKDAYKK